MKPNSRPVTIVTKDEAVLQPQCLWHVAGGNFRSSIHESGGLSRSDADHNPTRYYVIPEGQDFQGIKLHNRTFTRTVIRSSNFSGATFSRSHFNDADFSLCCFVGADFTDIKNFDVNLTKANLAGANFSLTNLEPDPERLSGAILIGCTGLKKELYESYAITTIDKLIETANKSTGEEKAYYAQAAEWILRYQEPKQEDASVDQMYEFMDKITKAKTSQAKRHYQSAFELYKLQTTERAPFLSIDERRQLTTAVEEWRENDPSLFTPFVYKQPHTQRAQTPRPPSTEIV